MCRVTVGILLYFAGSALAESNEMRLEDITDFVTDTITSMVAERPGIVECWFYTAGADPQPDNLLEMIQQHVALRSVSRMSLRQKLPDCGSRYPTVLVMDLRAVHTDPELLPPLEGLVLPLNTSVLVLINPWKMKQTYFLAGYFYNLALLNVLYIHTDENLSFYVNPFSIGMFEFYRSPTLVFPDLAQNVDGYHLKISHMFSGPNACFAGRNRSVGPAVDWVAITAQYINATFTIYQIECDVLNCSDQKWKMDDGTWYEFRLDIGDIMPIYLNHAVRSVVSVNKVLIAPRSSRLAIHEIFLVPFEKEVWITIFLVLVSCMLLDRLYSNHFSNNLILLVLCSFEKVALYRVKKLEKTVAISLIIFFFVLLSAYESLFISLMTNRPRLHNPRTIADLLKTNLKFVWKADYKIGEELRPIADYDSDFDTSDILDGHSAIFGDEYRLRAMLMKPENFDYEAGQSRYVMLDYSSWKGSEFYKFKLFSFFVLKFRYTQTVLEESGIFRKLNDDWEHLYLGSRFHQIRVQRFVASTTTLDSGQMMPAWIVIGFGWIVSFLGLLAELCWFKLSKIYIRKYNWTTIAREISNKIYRKYTKFVMLLRRKFTI